MSRIGKNPVNVPKEIKVAINSGNVHMEGPKGKMDLFIPLGTSVELKEGKLLVSRQTDTKQNRANHGTVRAKLANMIEGLTKGHKKELEIQGLGFRSQVQGAKIILNLGLSHQVEFNIPKEVKITVTPQNNVIVEGSDIEKVGAVAASLRDIKPVEPYKGKGIRYVGEVVKRKQGKSVTK